MSQVRGSNYGSKKMALFISAITTYLYNYIWYMYLDRYIQVGMCIVQHHTKKTNEASQLTYMYIVHTLARLIVILLESRKKYYNKHKMHTNHTNIYDSYSKYNMCRV